MKQRNSFLNTNFPHFFVSVSVAQVSKTFGDTQQLGGPKAVEIFKQLEEMCPLDKLAEKREWRDNCLRHLSMLKKKL